MKLLCWVSWFFFFSRTFCSGRQFICGSPWPFEFCFQDFLGFDLASSRIHFSLGLVCASCWGLCLLVSPLVARYIHRGLFTLAGGNWMIPALCELWELFGLEIPSICYFLGNCSLSSLINLHTTHMQIGIYPETQGDPFCRYLEHFYLVYSFVVIHPANSNCLRLHKL